MECIWIPLDTRMKTLKFKSEKLMVYEYKRINAVIKSHPLSALAEGEISWH